MKHLLMVALVLAGFMVVMVPTSADAAYCRADSRSAYGWGSAGTYAQARRIAMRQCVIRTPRWQTCYISWCR